MTQDNISFQALAMPDARAATAAVQTSPTVAITDWIDRHRRIWFALVGLFLACSFNGQWHLGPDSAGYRQLGHNLATRGRYFFRADIPGVDEYHNEQGTRYPGLPIVLAALERIFGERALPPLVMMMLLAVLTLVLIYRLMLYRLPRWLAICVAVGVGTNPRFLQYANEILSDLPFLFGVIVTLLGFEQVMHATDRKRLSIGILNTFLGLLIAAAMRPTFMILAAALVAACIWGIIRGRVGIGAASAASAADADNPQPSAVRLRSALLIAALVMSTVLFVGVIDIRQRQGGFLSGGYEERITSKLENFGYKVAPLLPYNIAELLEDALPMAVMGARSGWGLVPMAGHHLGFGTGFSFIVIISAIGLARRNMLLGMFVLMTVGALILFGSVPRYFLMILPLLLAGWGLAIQTLARQFPSTAASRFVMGFGLFLLLALNLVASSTFILTQRGFSKALDSHHRWTGFHYVGFLRAYDFGRWVGFDRLALEIKRSSAPNDKIIGPNANVLTFLTDRQVYEPIIGNRTKAAGQLFHLALFPADPDWHRSTGEYEEKLKQFLRTLHKREGADIAGLEANLKLAELVKAPAHHLSAAEKIEHARQMAAHKRRAARMATRSHL